MRLCTRVIVRRLDRRTRAMSIYMSSDTLAPFTEPMHVSGVLGVRMRRVLVCGFMGGGLFYTYAHKYKYKNAYKNGHM